MEKDIENSTFVFQISGEDSVEKWNNLSNDKKGEVYKGLLENNGFEFSEKCYIHAFQFKKIDPEFARFVKEQFFCPITSLHHNFFLDEEGGEGIIKNVAIHGVPRPIEFDCMTEE